MLILAQNPTNHEATNFDSKSFEDLHGSQLVALPVTGVTSARSSSGASIRSFWVFRDIYCQNTQRTQRTLGDQVIVFPSSCW